MTAAHLPRILSHAFCISTSEARRCVVGGGVYVDNRCERDIDVPWDDLLGRTLRLGGRREIKLDHRVHEHEGWRWIQVCPVCYANGSYDMDDLWYCVDGHHCDFPNEEIISRP